MNSEGFPLVFISHAFGTVPDMPSVLTIVACDLKSGLFLYSEVVHREAKNMKRKNKCPWWQTEQVAVLLDLLGNTFLLFLPYTMCTMGEASPEGGVSFPSRGITI